MLAHIETIGGAMFAGIAMRDRECPGVSGGTGRTTGCTLVFILVVNARRPRSYHEVALVAGTRSLLNLLGSDKGRLDLMQPLGVNT